MKFKTILTEAMIDTLPMSKFDKSVLKLIHTELLKGSASDDDIAGFLTKMSKKVVIDMHEMVTLYMTYVKYKDLLFSEEGVEKVTIYDTLSPELFEITRGVIIRYIKDNYDEKLIFNSDGVEANINFMEDIETMLANEMVPDCWFSYPVTGEYEGTLRWGGNKGEKYKTTDTDVRGTIYLNIMPSSDGKAYGFDVLSFSEESLGDWLVTHEGKKHSDVIDGGSIKTSFLKPIENYTEKELKRFVEQWIGVLKRLLRKNIPTFEKYKDFVEHGGSIYENKKKRKTIK